MDWLDTTVIAVTCALAAWRVVWIWQHRKEREQVLREYIKWQRVKMRSIR